MKVAIIEENKIYLDALKKITRSCSWEIDFFESSEEFGKVILEEYSVIIADQDLSTIQGRDLLKTIAKKTSAELFLMCSGFQKEDVLNGSIAGLIDKGRPQNVIDQLKYIHSKLKVTKLMENESDELEELINGNKPSL